VRRGLTSDHLCSRLGVQSQGEQSSVCLCLWMPWPLTKTHMCPKVPPLGGVSSQHLMGPCSASWGPEGLTQLPSVMLHPSKLMDSKRPSWQVSGRRVHWSCQRSSHMGPTDGQERVRMAASQQEHQLIKSLIDSRS
jgi:hypothetical protein